MDLINDDFKNLSREIRLDYTVRKEILWESKDASEKDLSKKEVEYIRKYEANNRDIGYNQWPKFVDKDLP